MFNMLVGKIKIAPKISIILLIKVYQVLISPILMPRCRFHPSCSQYTKLSIKRFGLIRGLGYSLLRILKCQPLCKGGFDPVPNKIKKANDEQY